MTQAAATAAPAPTSEATDAPPLSQRRTIVLALAGVTTAVEAASVAGILDTFAFGGLNLSVALIPALALAVACGSRLLGRSSLRHAALGFWVAVGILLPALAVAFVRTGRGDAFVALVLAALGEELIYRLAIPAVVAASLRLGNVRPNTARIAGLAFAGLWFVLLPGHLEQIDGLLGFLPYISFASLSAFIVYRSGSILPMAIGHAISNLLTVLVWREAVPADARSVGLACILGLLVLAYGRSQRLTIGDDGELLDTHTGLGVTAIDLRDGQPALVELTDGRVLPVHANMVQIPGSPLHRLPRRKPPTS